MLLLLVVLMLYYDVLIVLHIIRKVHCHCCCFEVAYRLLYKDTWNLIAQLLDRLQRNFC